jgi:probable rRNA maturation factor
MNIEVDVASVGVRAPLGRDRVARIVAAVVRAERVRSARISVTFLANAAMARLNWAHLRHRGPTDVISFELAPDAATAARQGDIYIAPAVARAQARLFGVGVREEVARLVVHGTLHVLGHEHPEGEERLTSPMWRRQERLLARVLVAEAS